MVKYGMLIDISRCIGCYNCVLACKDEHVGNEYPGYSAPQPTSGHFWIRIIERERGRFPKVKMSFIPVLCMHCEDAPCVKVAGDGSVYQRPDGIIIIDPEKAVGRKDLLQSCPYRVIYWNEERKLPQKCTFCAHLLDSGWKKPRCVEVCPTDALIFGDLDNPNSKISKILSSVKAEIFHEEFGLRGHIFYVNLPKRFIAGTIMYSDTKECAEGVTVTLIGADGEQQKTKTNFFGDFEFEGLKKNADYTVLIEAPGYKPCRFNVRTVNDVYLGKIILEKET